MNKSNIYYLSVIFIIIHIFKKTFEFTIYNVFAKSCVKNVLMEIINNV